METGWLIFALTAFGSILGGAIGAFWGLNTKIDRLREDIYRDGGLKDTLEQKIVDSRHKMANDLTPLFDGQDKDIEWCKKKISRLLAKAFPHEPGIDNGG